MSEPVMIAVDRQKNLEDIDAIRKRGNAKKMLSESFFTHIKQNRLTPEQHEEFFCQYYTIVKTSYRMLVAGILSAPAEDCDTIEHLVKFLETESGGHPNHLGHYLRWAESFGVSKEDLINGTPNEKSRDFDETLMTYFASPDSLVKQAAQLGLEDCAEVLIDGLDKGFKRYPMTAKAYGYLAIHRLLENDEEGHSRWAIDSIVNNPELSSRLADVERIYRRVYDIFSGVFEGVHEAWYAAKRAAA